MVNESRKSQRIAIIGIFFAIMLAFLIFMPLNAYVPLIALMVIALTENWKMGFVGGLMFGIASWISAAVFPSSPLYLVFMNPLVSILPRIIVGGAIFFIAKAVYNLACKKFRITISEIDYETISSEEMKLIRQAKYISYVIACISGALINTILVIGTMFLLYNGETHFFEGASVLITPEVILPLISISAITEPIVCAIIVPPVVLALQKIR